MIKRSSLILVLETLIESKIYRQKSVWNTKKTNILISHLNNHSLIREKCDICVLDLYKQIVTSNETIKGFYQHANNKNTLTHKSLGH